mgnify:CR=1 FL=1
MKVTNWKREPVNRNDDILHWVTLAMIIDFLVDEYGFEWLAERFKMNCFHSHPSKASALKFLRKTEWARLQVQWLYVKTKLDNRKRK